MELEQKKTEEVDDDDKSNEEQDVDIKRYKEVSGVSLSKLNLGYFLLSQKNKVKIAFTVFLVISALGLWSFSIYNWALIISQTKDHEQMIYDLANTPTNQNYFLSIAPKNLIYSKIVSMQSTPEKYDLAVKIENKNSEHIARFDYCFIEARTEIDCKTNVIFPKQTKHILSLGNKFTKKSSNVSFKIKTVQWQRINKHQFPDWQNFFNTHLGIEISNEKYINGAKNGLSIKNNINSFEFNVKNNTPYSYRDVIFNIIFYNGAQISGAHSYTLPELMTGEEKFATAHWAGKNISVGKIIVEPEINILDENIYIKFKGE